MINLSVDGGGTKINIIAFDEHYSLLGFGTGGGINIRYETKERVAEHISNAIIECMKNIDNKHIDTVYCTMVGGHELFTYAAEQLGYTIERLSKMPEGYTYLLAGGMTEKGFVALSGTGSGALYCDGKDNILHLGGYGTPIGDDGSGAWIGIKGINAVTRYLSGWGEKTTLSDKLFDYLEITDARHNILNALYPTDRSTRSLYAKFAPFVGKEADAGDLISLNIVKEAGVLMAEQVLGVAKVLSGRNDILYDIYACGGAWKCSEYMFLAFKDKIKEYLPNANCLRGKFDPVVGGLIRDMIENKKSIIDFTGLLNDEYRLFASR